MWKQALMGMWALGLTGCGVVMLPLSVPESVMSNQFLRFRATVTDEAGRPLPEVTVEEKESLAIPSLNPGIYSLFNRLEWHTTDRKFLAQNGRIDKACWAEDLHFQVTAPGYYRRTLMVNKEGISEYFAEDGRSEVLNTWNGMPNRLLLQKHSPIELRLEKRIAPANLVRYNRSPMRFADGSFEYVDLDASNVDVGPLPHATSDQHPLPPNVFYISSDWNSRSSEKPYAPVTLRLTSAGGGFLRIAADRGRPADGRIRTAPEQGYVSELVITEQDRRELDRLSTRDLSKSAGIPFYVKTDRYFGRGNIHGVTADRKVYVWVEVFLQPDGSRNVE